MADDATADLRVIAWQQWQAPRARLRTPFGEPWDGDGPGPPGAPGGDTVPPPFWVIAWQQWRAGRAQLASQYAGGAFDDSAAAPIPPVPDTPAPPFVVVAWQQWRALPARLVTQWSQQLWDGDGAGPIAPVPDFPPPTLSVIAWQQWRSGRAQLARPFTDAPQDLDGFMAPSPDPSLVVLPWFTGRVPLERARTIYFTPVADGPEPAQPETQPSYVYGRGYHPSRFSPRARLGTVLGGSAQDDSFTPTPEVAEYIPTYRPRRRL